MCNKITCAGQYTVDLINNNIGRYVQEECANRLYRVYIYIYTAAIWMVCIYIYTAAIWMVENNEYLTDY